ncbi:hypothetical protein L211DRAFT_824339 [Terfezia boudieri ATCC MYA-4762]|uniref:Nuclear distribution protein RO10 n=1 Tax=Terfezia boudieri ATCC MYA-4762 TaxID=1051890 RepID=A0A3N4LNC3_9PEZI|nr:hypothetical protein L211DRAFT_824339 [Terfezia boudieri ATCC MYA-4762]
MDNPLEHTADETIRALNLRLRRLEYLLHGGSPTMSLSEPPPLPPLSTLTRENSVRARIDSLDKQLLALYNRHPTVRAVLDLYVQYPTLFSSPHLPTPLPQHLFPPNPALPSSSLSPAEKFTTILATSTAYQTFSSQLNSIMDSPIPNPNTSIELISLIPRINKVELLQEAQIKEISELRKRSARLLERWYLVGVEGGNECAAEWEERTGVVERVVGRVERGIREEMGQGVLG